MWPANKKGPERHLKVVNNLLPRRFGIPTVGVEFIRGIRTGAQIFEISTVNLNREKIRGIPTAIFALGIQTGKRIK